MKRHIKHPSITVAVVLGILALGMGAFVYSGVYDVGADDHHTKPVFAALQTLRENSIHARSKDIVVPDLDDPQLILKGAGQYAAMCTQCHLRPGVENSEQREGMYPLPPNLSKARVAPQEAFWITKHGIKMSGMPAWGVNHDDPTIWSMVAFLQKLPDMTPAQYQDMVARAPADHDMGTEGGHSHADAVEDGHDHAAAPVPAAEVPLSLDGMKPKAVPEAEAVAEALQTALQHGDRAAVLALLAPDATISEGGHTQSRDEYADGHLGEDIAFLKDAKIALVALGSMPMGNTAMVGSESDIQTTVKGQSTTLRSRELLTLRKDGKDWKIVSIQWQSTPVSGT